MIAAAKIVYHIRAIINHFTTSKGVHGEPFSSYNSNLDCDDDSDDLDICRSDTVSGHYETSEKKVEVEPKGVATEKERGVLFGASKGATQSDRLEGENEQGNE